MVQEPREQRNRGAVAAGVLGAGLGTAALIAALTQPSKAQAAGEPQYVVLDGDTRQALATLLLGQEATHEDIKKIKFALSQFPAQGEAIMPGKIEQIAFPFNLAPLQGVTLSQTPAAAGYIKQITIHWPDGCNALVDVRVGHGLVQICPREGYLALNDATPSYPFSEWVEAADEVWVEMRNGDAVNLHSITVTVTVESAA